jgi:hypothetical protein
VKRFDEDRWQREDDNKGVFGVSGNLVGREWKLELNWDGFGKERERNKEKTFIYGIFEKSIYLKLKTGHQHVSFFVPVAISKD